MRRADIVTLLFSALCYADDKQVGTTPLTLSTFDGGFNITNRDPNYSTQTTYKFNKCSPEDAQTLQDATYDAVNIAYAGLMQVPREGAAPISMVDFDSQAAIDFFGPPQETIPLRGRIETTIKRASEAYPGWGWSDWWNNRYVILACDDVLKEKKCRGDVRASTILSRNPPTTIFCSGFFDDTQLPTTGQMQDKIRDNRNQEQQNSYNGRSKGTTMLHEWIHYRTGSAQVCPGGALDQWIHLGSDIRSQDHVQAYRPAAAKLLAATNVTAASLNNDNYVYYCIQEWMRKTFLTTPQYPKAWNPKWSLKSNQDRDSRYPGALPPDQVVSYDIDSEETSSNDTVDVSNQYPGSEYPSWYQPIISEATASDASVPAVTPPPEATSPTSMPTPDSTLAAGQMVQSAPPYWGDPNSPLLDPSNPAPSGQFVSSVAGFTSMTPSAHVITGPPGKREAEVQETSPPTEPTIAPVTEA